MSATWFKCYPVGSDGSITAMSFGIVLNDCLPFRVLPFPSVLTAPAGAGFLLAQC